MRKTARLIGTRQWLFDTAHVYKLSEAVPWDDEQGHSGTTQYVIVSVGFGALDHRQFEAMAFACGESGEFLPDGDYGPGCDVAVKVGTINHDDAVRELGFEVVDERIIAALWRRLAAKWLARRRRRDYCVVYREGLSSALAICRFQAALSAAITQFNEQLLAAVAGYETMISAVVEATESAAAFSELFKDDKGQLDEETLN